MFHDVIYFCFFFFLNIFFLINFFAIKSEKFNQKKKFKKLVERWISRFLASLKVAANCEMLVVWIARHIGPFRAAEHLTHWTNISLCRLSVVFYMSPAARLVESALFIICFFKLIQILLHFFFFDFFFFKKKIENKKTKA